MNSINNFATDVYIEEEILNDSYSGNANKRNQYKYIIRLRHNMLWRRAWDEDTDYLAGYVYQDTHLSPVVRDNNSTHSNCVDSFIWNGIVS